VAVAKAAAPPPRDPDGSCRIRLRELAVAAGVEPGRLIDEWHGRVDVLVYQRVYDAEQVALRQVEERLGPQEGPP
jgi:hypothetical protein